MQFENFTIQKEKQKKKLSTKIVDHVIHKHGASVQKIQQIFNTDESRFLNNSTTVYKYAIQEISKNTDLNSAIRSISSNHYVGSIAYVFKAILKDGDTIAIKIIREDKALKIEKDIANKTKLLNTSKAFLPIEKFDHIDAFTDQFLEDIRQEYSFNNEIQNHADFSKVIQNLKHLSLPNLYLNLSSHDILVYQWIDESKSLHDIKNSLNAEKLQNELTELFLGQTFLCGYFQEDTNLGNFIYHQNKLYLLDFGKISYLTENERICIISLLYARDSNLEINYGAVLSQLGFNEELLSPIIDKITKILDIMFDPWLTNNIDYNYSEWRPMQKIKELLGDGKWNYRAASPYVYFKLTRSMIGFLKVSKIINLDVQNLSKIKEQLFSKYKDQLFLDK